MGCVNSLPPRGRWHCKAMTEGACVHFEFFARFILIIQACFLRILPQSRIRSTAPSRREPFSQHILRFSFVCFIIIGNSLFEPRDYRVVFVIQKETLFRTSLTKLFIVPQCSNASIPIELGSRLEKVHQFYHLGVF